MIYDTFVIYPLKNLLHSFGKSMHDSFSSMIYLLNKLIFYSYDELPEGNQQYCNGPWDSNGIFMEYDGLITPAVWYLDIFGSLKQDPRFGVSEISLWHKWIGTKDLILIAPGMNMDRENSNPNIHKYIQPQNDFFEVSKTHGACPVAEETAVLHDGDGKMVGVRMLIPLLLSGQLLLQKNHLNFS